MNTDRILRTMPEDFKKQVNSISVVSSIESGNLIILHLKRDQYIKFKKIANTIIETNKDLHSVYTEFGGKLHHVGGMTSIKDNVNGYEFLVGPLCPIKDKRQIALYRKLRDLSPKGKTRNAIIIGTHSGLIPIHVSHLYNKLYCIDEKKYSAVEAKDNIRLNKINNCLVFNESIHSWMVDFENYRYTLPGRKHKVGLLIADSSILLPKDIEKIITVDPETIIFLSEQSIKKDIEKMLIKAGFSITVETNVNEFQIHKIKKVTLDETV